MMFSFKEGDRVLVGSTAQNPEIRGRVGRVSHRYSTGYAAFNVILDGETNPRYLYGGELDAVPEPTFKDGDRVVYQNSYHGTVQGTKSGGVQVVFDRDQSWPFSQECIVDARELAGLVEPPMGVGDRVRLALPLNPFSINGATGSIVGPSNLPGCSFRVKWDVADHVAAPLRGHTTDEARRSLQATGEEPKVERPEPKAEEATEVMAAAPVVTNQDSLSVAVQKHEVAEFNRAASQALKAVAAKRATFTTDHLWAAMEKAHPEGFIVDGRALGAFMTTAKRLGYIAPTKRTQPSKRRECHHRPVRVWRFTQALGA